MPGCAAIGCNNRSEKGYTMKCFPRDPKLRRIWKERVGRADWEPSNNSFLCHIHFESHQWMVTQNGRIRLKRDALPSIFTITSTRKSPKKRKWEHMRQGDDAYYVIEYLENDNGYEQVVLLDDENKGMNQEFDERSAGSLEPRVVEGYAQGANVEGENCPEVSHEILTVDSLRHLDGNNVIIVTDKDNKEIGKLIRAENNVSIRATESEVVPPITADQGLQQQNAKAVVRNGTDHASHFQTEANHSYDEIEEKLKQICDGESTSVLPTVQKDAVESKLAAITKTASGTEIGFGIERNITDNSIQRTNLRGGGHSKSTMNSDEEIPRNVEIIFGSESDGDSRNTNDSHLLKNQNGTECAPQQNKDETEEKATLTNGTTDLKVGLLHFSEDIEENFSKDDVHIIPNIRAAMDSKESIRDKVLKTVEETFARIDEARIKRESHDPIFEESDENERQNEIGDVVKKESEENSKSTSELDSDLSMLKRTRFTIKVTGASDDVSEIIEGLGPVERRSRKGDSSYIPGEKVNITSRDHRGNAFITSVIAVQDDSKWRSDRSAIRLDEYDGPSDDGEYILPESIENKFRENMKTQTHDASRTHFKRKKSFLQANESKAKSLKLSSRDGIAERSESTALQVEMNNAAEVPDIDGKTPMRIACENNASDPYEELQKKLGAQKSAIEKLTKQLMTRKDMESTVANLKLELRVKSNEITCLQNRLSYREMIKADQFCATGDLDSKRKTIAEFSKKFKQMDDTNKRLMKVIRCESEESRRLKSQLKQKDDLIKELYWKIKKASKFLERAEKNANNYKRKMLSMQALIKREKYKDETRNYFKELLVENAKHEFSDVTLLTAMEIKKSCGKEGYEKLLGYDFPLPSLRTLRRRFSKKYTTEDERGDDGIRESPLEYQYQSVKMELAEQSDTNETEITGTVQDIFEECNDCDDPNSSELREHFFNQLNAAM